MAAAAWAVFGLVVLVASWRIDRLENLGINPWSVPGLLPGVIGALIFLLALALAWQTRHATMPAEALVAMSTPAASTGPAAGAAAGSAASAEQATAAGAATPAAPQGTMREWLRTLAAGTLCVLFAGASLGRGLPFMAEAATFIFLFISAFSWSQWRTDGRVLRGLATTLAIAAAASLLISWLFESVFLVRLP